MISEPLRAVALVGKRKLATSNTDGTRLSKLSPKQVKQARALLPKFHQSQRRLSEFTAAITTLDLSSNANSVIPQPTRRRSNHCFGVCGSTHWPDHSLLLANRHRPSDCPQ